jgi:outer membrane protein
MKTIPWAVIVGFWVLLTPNSAHAQTVAPRTAAVPESQVIRLSDAVAAARQHVPSVLAAVSQVRAAEGQVWLTRAALWPSASASVSAGGTVQNTDAAGANLAACGSGITVCATGNGSSQSIYGDATLSARWTIWDFGQTRLKVKAANLAADGARADLFAAEQVAIAAAATAYYALLADQEAVTASGQILQQRERQFDIARRRVSAGTNPPIDATRAEIAVQTSRLDLATAEAAVLMDAASLGAALAMDPAVPVRGTTPPEIAVDDDPTRAAEVALLIRPEIDAARARYEAAEARIAASRAGGRPSLVSTVSANVRRTTAFEGVSPPGTEEVSGTIGLSLPLFDPTLRPNTNVAEANALSARAEVAKQKLQVRTDAVQAATAARSARHQMELALRNVALNAANLRLSETRYAAGTAPLIELLDAEAQDAASRLTVIQRQFQWERAKVSLLASTGRLGELGRQ